jgi:hypothetical protein
VTPDGSAIFVVAQGGAGLVGAFLNFTVGDSGLSIGDATGDAAPWPLVFADGSAVPVPSGQAWIVYRGGTPVLCADGGNTTLVYPSVDYRVWTQ